MEGIRPSIAQFVLTEFTPAAFRQRLADPNVEVAIADMNGHLVGYAVIRHGAVCPCDSDAGSEIQTLYVQPRFARGGVGSMLLDRCRHLVRQRNATAGVWLSVNARNGRAVAFYRKHGWQQVGSIDFEFSGEKHENHVLVAQQP